MGLPSISTAKVPGQDQQREWRYHNRIERMKKLIDLQAPPAIIANEAILIAAAVYSDDMSVDGLATVIQNSDDAEATAPSSHSDH